MHLQRLHKPYIVVRTKVDSQLGNIQILNEEQILKKIQELKEQVKEKLEPLTKKQAVYFTGMPIFGRKLTKEINFNHGYTSGRVYEQAIQGRMA